MKKVLTLAVVSMAIWLSSLSAQQNNPIVKLDPRLDEIVPAGAKLEKLGDGFVFLEGPVWVRNGGYLLFSNMPERFIAKWTPDGKITKFLDLEPFAKNADFSDAESYLSNGLTIDGQGRLVYVSQIEKAVFRIEKDGSRTVLADKYDGKPFGRPNDLVYKSNGALYFTDNGRGNTALPNSVYLLKDGKLQVITTELNSPNGIAISPDEKILYVNDISRRTVWRFDIQPDDTVTNRRLFVDMSSNKAPGGPDGMKVDKKGNVYDSGPGGLWILTPEGKHLGTILTPDRVSNLAFGDADGKTLYITLHEALYRIRLNIEGVRP
jgi:gluconolactonase